MWHRFLVPLFAAQGVSSNFFCPRGQLELVANHLRRRSPWWRRSNGADHVFFATGDKGACGLSYEVARTSILVSHFGLLGSFAQMPRAAALARRLDDAQALVSEVERAEWCFAPHKDIVAPPLAPLQPRATAATKAAPRAGAAAASAASSSTDADPTRRWRYLLAHAGGVYSAAAGRRGRANGGWNRSHYSQGLRQQLFERFGTRGGHGTRGGTSPPTSLGAALGFVPSVPAHGILVADGRVPDATFSLSKFCLAPSGQGWGIRLVKAVLGGCLPLIAQPLVEQPFEALLPYELFSLRLGYGEGELDALPSTLSDASLPRERVVRMRRRLAAASRAFEWRAEAGGLAYNFTLLALCHRAVQLRGRLLSGGGCGPLARALAEATGGWAPLGGGEEAARRGGLPQW